MRCEFFDQMVENIDVEVAAEEMETELLTDVSTDDDGELLAIGRGKLHDRRMDRKIRMIDGTLQEAHDVYYKGEMFQPGEWNGFELISVSSDEQTVVTGGAGHTPERTPIDEWLESYGTSMFADYLTEVWEDSRRHFENEDNST